MAVNSWGAHPAIHASPEDTELSCMLWLSVGVNQMKFVPALSCAMTVFESPEIRFAHRAEFPVIVVYDRKGKWSSPRGGESPQPDPPALSAMARHVFPAFSMRSTIVGWFRFGWFPSPETPNRSEEHTSELQSPCNLVCRLLLEKKKIHTHVVVSATPKDGPSAGVGIVTSTVSVLTGIALNSHCATTYGISLHRSELLIVQRACH